MPAPFLPKNSALLLIDHQLGTMQLIKNLPLDEVKRATLALSKAAKMCIPTEGDRGFRRMLTAESDDVDR